jgi:hypothetical protein
MSSRQLVLVITWRWWCVKWNFVCSTFYSISGLYSVLESLQCIRLVTWPIDMKNFPWICGWFATVWPKEYIERRHSEPWKFFFLPKMGLLGSQASTRKNPIMNYEPLLSLFCLFLLSLVWLNNKTKFGIWLFDHWLAQPINLWRKHCHTDEKWYTTTKTNNMSTTVWNYTIV